jgi:hypothetical protein
MEANTSSLSKNIEQLQQKIESENEKAAKLEKRISMNVGIGKQEAILQALGEKVTQVRLLSIFFFNRHFLSVSTFDISSIFWMVETERLRPYS